MNVKKISCILFLALTGISLSGQVRQPHSLYFMETIPQVSQMNPAFQPRANGYLLLPANVNVDLLSDLSVKDIFQKQGNKWPGPFEKQYDYAKLWKSIGKKAAQIHGGIDIDIIGYGIRAGNGYLSIGISEHISSDFALPRDIFHITDKGFPTGTKLDFSPLHRSRAIAYKQFLIGYSRKMNEKWTVGVNIKPLFGQFAVASDIRKFSINTAEKQWNLGVKGNVYSSLPCDVITNAEGKIDDVKFRYDFSDEDDYQFNDWIKDNGNEWLQDYGWALRNPGIAFDFGAACQIDERLTISASLTNLGFISWKEDLNSISFNGNYKLKGVYFDVSSDDDLKDQLDELWDSITDAMSYKVKNSKFKTTLPPALHAGASYKLSGAVSAGLLSRTVFLKNNVCQSFNLSLYYQPYSFAAFNAGASWQVKGNVYLGGGLTFFLGPLQIYILADHAPIFYSTLKIDDHEIPYVPERLKTFTARTGVNIVFGKHGFVNKPMLDKGKSSWN